MSCFSWREACCIDAWRLWQQPSSEGQAEAMSEGAKGAERESMIAESQPVVKEFVSAPQQACGLTEEDRPRRISSSVAIQTDDFSPTATPTSMPSRLSRASLDSWSSETRRSPHLGSSGDPDSWCSVEPPCTPSRQSSKGSVEDAPTPWACKDKEVEDLKNELSKLPDAPQLPGTPTKKQLFTLSEDSPGSRFVTPKNAANRDQTETTGLSPESGKSESSQPGLLSSPEAATCPEEVPLEKTVMCEHLEEEIKTWPEAQNKLYKIRETYQTLLELLLDEQASEPMGGTLLVQAPTKEIIKLAWAPSDGDHLKSLLQEKHGLHVSNGEFRKLFSAFVQKNEGDCWPHTKIPKDGGLAISATGYIRCAAAKFKVSDEAHVNWPNKGTRHSAALGLANMMRHAIIFVRSENGDLHILLPGRDQNKQKVYKLNK
eukprot:TRINITY_DN97617_c0_g1_i1.p1 TRINITY_DN97617_c0_g1~~TRINITY_DN97617_c0_g1_i1.p1  ORF type:complete len:439 (+),score=67.67 TRINITY_DN97617_c0_g1_i1:29-1318(+)